MNIITKKHTLRLNNNNNLICKKPKNHFFELYIDDENVALFFTTNENKSGSSIMHCKRISVNDDKSLQLKHLSIPTEHRRRGLGKLSLAIMYAVLIDKNFDSFKIKFGGGNNSKSFITNLNFPTKLIHTIHNSVIVGDMEFIDESNWKFNPIPIYYFPKDFFEIR